MLFITIILLHENIHINRALFLESVICLNNKINIENVMRVREKSVALDLQD